MATLLEGPSVAGTYDPNVTLMFHPPASLESLRMLRAAAQAARGRERAARHETGRNKPGRLFIFIASRPGRRRQRRRYPLLE